MQMDILNFGNDDARARFTMDQPEAALLMEAVGALRESRFPGVLNKLPHHFDEAQLITAAGSREDANEILALLEVEQLFHQSLHLFPAGHAH